MRPSKILLLSAALVMGAVSSVRAQTYDAVSDFSGTNPSGAWSYLYSATVGSPRAPLTTPTTFNGQVVGLDDNSSIPTSVLVARNVGPGTTSYVTIVQPTNLLEMDPESLASYTQFTAPATANYSISGLFQGIDTGEGPHEVQILQDYQAGSPLFAATLNGFGQQQPFSFTQQLTAGETLDFTVNFTGDYSNLSTGLAATISVVPEPVSFGVMGVGVIGMLLRRKRA
jgi:hypothetical protein